LQNHGTCHDNEHRTERGPRIQRRLVEVSVGTDDHQEGHAEEEIIRRSAELLL